MKFKTVILDFFSSSSPLVSCVRLGGERGGGGGGGGGCGGRPHRHGSRGLSSREEEITEVLSQTHRSVQQIQRFWSFI